MRWTPKSGCCVYTYKWTLTHTDAQEQAHSCIHTIKPVNVCVCVQFCVHIMLLLTSGNRSVTHRFVFIQSGVSRINRLAIQIPNNISKVLHNVPIYYHAELRSMWTMDFMINMLSTLCTYSIKYCNSYNICTKRFVPLWVMFQFFRNVYLIKSGSART